MGVDKFGQYEDVKDWSRKIQDIMEKMQNRSFCDYRASGTWMPNVNIYATRTVYHICVELAGVERDSITVECRDAQHVSIAGHRVRPRAADLELPHSVELMEIDEGAFHREIDFSERVEVNTVEITCNQGCLWITLRKTVTT